MDSAFHPSNNWSQVASETPCKRKEESNVARPSKLHAESHNDIDNFAFYQNL